MYACVYAPTLSSENKQLLLECARTFSPAIEEVDDFTLVIDINGLSFLYPRIEEIPRAIEERLRASGLSANVAIAPNPDVAIIAARHFIGSTMISERSAQALANLKIEALQLTPEIAEAFELWGIRTFQDLASLPLAGIVARLGPKAEIFQQMARGASERPLILGRAEESFTERVEFEEPIHLLEPLLFVLGKSLGGLCEKLRSLGMAAAEVDLKLELEDRTVFERAIKFPFPFDRSRTLLKLIHLDLMSHPPQAPLTALTMSLVPTPSRTVQEGLLVPLSPEPEKLEVTLARIRALVGEKNLGAPALVDTHRPDAFRLIPLEMARRGRLKGVPSVREPQLAFRFFRPALEARVSIWMDRPARLSASGIQGKIVSASGPWRSSGDWWRADSWDRDEWDISLQNGALYRLCQNADRRWILEGAYD
jgi:protein ImuB